MRRTILLVAKGAISILLLYLALHWVNAGDIIYRIARIDLRWGAFCIGVMLIQQILLAERWRQILLQCGGDFSFARLFRFNMIGAFFTQTLPSSFGGDAMRLWLIAQRTNWRVAAYSVLLDRVFGVIALAIVVVVGLPWSFQLIHNPVGRSALLLLGLGSLAAGTVFIGLPWNAFRPVQHWPLTRHFAAAATVASAIVRSPASLILTLGLSVFVHLLSIVSAWCLASSVDAHLSFLDALLLVPPVILATIFPISIAGWGVREGAMVAVFAYAGLLQDDGLVVSVLLGLASMAIGIIGGIIWIFQTERVDRAKVAVSVSD